MRSWESSWLAVVLAISVVASGGGCRDARTNDRGTADADPQSRSLQPSIEYVVLDGSLEALRTTFNADSGDVRAILLAAPT